MIAVNFTFVRIFKKKGPPNHFQDIFIPLCNLSKHLNMTVSKTTKDKCRNIHILHICLIQFESKMKVAFSSFCAKFLTYWDKFMASYKMKLMNYY